jgi:hypothetical protein
MSSLEALDFFQQCVAKQWGLSVEQLQEQRPDILSGM